MASYLDETGLLKLWNKIKNYVSNHTGNKNNPHGVTKSQVGLGSVENKSSATIRGEITASNVNTALGYTAAKQTDANKAITGISASGTTLVLTQLDGTTKYVTADLDTHSNHRCKLLYITFRYLCLIFACLMLLQFQTDIFASKSFCCLFQKILLIKMLFQNLAAEVYESSAAEKSIMHT